ncbi:ABC transporter substrate-binding protein [Frankia sp. AgKG'84/4]|uniref:ABC transporter substrate-binding protein n=1 Tax=Frankia sp. AgKG'84/4 TaxID=573490 RepID=UPI0027E56EFB|nr:ABC transporter substrate-binding protein [Frankia sp. AgKG'84/4]
MGGLVSKTSPTGVAFGDADVGAKVRFARANDEGGVNGRKIDYIGSRDDGTEPGRTADQARAIVEKDQVFVASPVTVMNGNYNDAFCNAGLPFFGWGNNTGFCGNALGFSINGCQAPKPGQQRTVDTGGSVGVAPLLPAGAAKTVGVVGVDNEAAKQGLTTVSQGFQSAGFKVVYNKSPIPVSGLTDATPVINAILKSDGGRAPSVIFMVAAVGDSTKVASALKAAGYKGVIMTPIYDPRLSGVKELDDTYALLQWAPGFATNVPAVATMAKDFQKYAPGAPLSLTAVAGYLSAEFTVDALTKTGPNLTVSSFLKTLNGGGYTYYRPGLVAESRWPLNHVTSVPCATIAHLKDGKWSAPPLVCGVVTKAG